MDTETLLTIEEVAARLHITVGTARNRLSSENAEMPPSIRSGRRRLFPLSEYNEWVNELSRKQNPKIHHHEEPQGRGRPRKLTEVKK